MQGRDQIICYVNTDVTYIDCMVMWIKLGLRRQKISKIKVKKM